jgi:hypothetical protein
MTDLSGAADHQAKREKRKQTPEEIVRRLQARIVKAQAGECEAEGRSLGASTTR